MEQARRNWTAWAAAWPRKALRRATAPATRGYLKLTARYGPRHARAMLIVTVVAFFLPVPGSTLIGIGLIAMTAELHRAIARRFGFRGRRRIAVGGGPLAPNPSR